MTEKHSDCVTQRDSVTERETDVGYWNTVTETELQTQARQRVKSKIVTQKRLE